MENPPPLSDQCLRKALATFIRGISNGGGWQKDGGGGGATITA